MQFKMKALSAVLALSLGLGACGQPTQVAPQPAPTDGGYGPFGADAPAAAPVTSTPFAQPGVERVVSGALGAVPPEFQSLITGYLDRYAQQMAEGWSTLPSVPDAITGLEVDSELRWQVSLRGGQAYAFIGACDNECKNVDLVVEDSAGAQVNADILADDYPLVDVTPQADGIYTVRVQLKSCSVAPCYVGARLVRR